MWDFKNTSWLSDDKAQSFQLKRLYDKEYTAKPFAPLGMLIGAKRHKRVIADIACTAGDFPLEFSYCPFCKEPLSAPESKSSSSWLPPYGNQTGLKITSEELKPNSLFASNGNSVTLPSMNGRFSFCTAYMGATQRLLIALQRDVGRLSIYQPDTGIKWRDIDGKLGGDDLPQWSWSLATDAMESGLAIPTSAGPVWVTVDWASETLHVDRGEGRSVAGIARLGKVLLAPVMRGNHFYILYRKDGDTKWSECKTSFDLSIVAPQLTRKEDQRAFLGIPVIDETRMVAYWACRGGYVKVIDTNPEDLAWEFRLWETDVHPATALIELGPPYKKIGSRTGFWQLCEDYDPTRRDSVVNKIIKIDGDERADTEELEYGQFVSTGRASFGWLYDHWNDIHQINLNAGEHKDIRYPLLQFGEKGQVLVVKVLPWQGQPDMGAFSEVFSPAEKSSVWIRFVVEGAGIPEKALVAEGVDGGAGPAGSLFKLSLSQLSDLAVFIYNASLYIYLPEDNKCFAWSLYTLES